MSHVWYCIPSANAPQCTETFARWQAAGYMTAVLIDGDAPEPENADLIVRVEQYPGYGGSVNELCRRLPDVDWIITGGDDTYPDETHSPDQIAQECDAHFKGTFGVMQPTGDPWLENCIKNFCGSPWMGREFRRRANMGTGPYCAAYGHLYDDTELQNIAIRERCFWQRPDLAQIHNHWTKKGIPRPEYLLKYESNVFNSKRLFETRRAAGFPGSEFLP